MAELPAAASRNLRQAYSPEVVHSPDHHTTSDPLQTLVPANHCYTPHITDHRAPRVKRYTLSAHKTATQAICATLSGTKVYSIWNLEYT